MKFVSLTDGKEIDLENIQVTGWWGPTIPAVRRDDDIEGPKNLYWLFAGDDYYPAGGINDFVGTFDTIEEAKDAFYALERHDWGHIVTVKKNGFTIVIETYDEIEGDVNYYGWRRPR